MISKALIDAREIASAWTVGLNLGDLITDGLVRAGVIDVDVDVVAIGKASREMANACHAVLGDHVQRTFIVSDEGGWVPPYNAEVMIGSHPLVSGASIAAGARLVDFLGEQTSASSTVFLVSGGASSLCALPLAPLTATDLRALWDAAMAVGLDITTLNKLRAATSAIAGGLVLGHVRTLRSTSLIMVDNVVSGEAWVASGLTYGFWPSPIELVTLVDQLNGSGSLLAERLLEAGELRRTLTSAAIETAHENIVIAAPSLVLRRTSSAAEHRGYRAVDLGSAVHGDVAAVGRHFDSIINDEARRGGPFCVLGVGEVTVRVRGSGRGGRCQELAWLMAPTLAHLDVDAVFAAIATDGRDFIDGVGGAWVDHMTMSSLETMNIPWGEIARNNDSFRGLSRLGQLLPGGRTGWNLCDLYLALVR